jgi:hypothetical protein
MRSISDGSQAHITGDETIGGEIDNPVIGKRHALARGFAGVFTEMNISRCDAENSGRNRSRDFTRAFAGHLCTGFD